MLAAMKPRRRGLSTPVIALSLVAALLAAAPADASRKPTTVEVGRITDALYGKFGCQAYPEGSCKLVVRVSTENQRWAAAYVRPTRGNEDVVQRDVASLERRNHRWRVHQIGNGGGCQVPPAVDEDLHLFCA